jgi:hypothetical protein
VSASFEFKPFVEKRFCLLLPPAYLLTADLLLLRLFSNMSLLDKECVTKSNGFSLPLFKDMKHPI